MYKYLREYIENTEFKLTLLNNPAINKLLDDELLITGEITNIEVLNG